MRIRACLCFCFFGSDLVVADDLSITLSHLVYSRWLLVDGLNVILLLAHDNVRKFEVSLSYKLLQAYRLL